MNFFNELLRQKPKGLRNLGILDFVRSHFDQISAIRQKGYSWKQIADTVQSRLHIPSRNLTLSFRTAFNREKRKRA